MTITSTAFQAGDAIPKKHSYTGDNINPPLTFSEIPREAKSLLLIVEDPDAPSGVFTHWIVFGISPGTMQINEGDLPINAKEATNDFGNRGYDGPKPPSGTHHYHFKLFALSEEPQIEPTDTRLDIYKAIDGKLIEKAEMIGTYSKEGN